MRLGPPPAAPPSSSGRVVAISAVGVASLAFVAVLVAIFHRAGGYFRFTATFITLPV